MVYRNVQFALGASTAALLLAACSGGGSSSSGPGANAIPQTQQMRQASHSHIPDSLTGRMGLPASFHGIIGGAREMSPGWLSGEAMTAPKAYVSDISANAVYIYNAITPGSPIGTITSGMNEPLGSYVDAPSGALYVTQLGANTVTVYPKGHTLPSKTYSSGLSGPIGVTVGKDGTVYVSEFSAGEVVEYAKGKSTPARTITISEAEGVALDNKNNLYVSYINANTGVGGVEKFAPKSTTGHDLGISVGFAGDVKLDKKNDVLLEDQDAQTVNFYKPGATSPYGTISVGGDTYKLALNQAETRLFVADTGNVPYYQAKPSGALEGTISSGLESAYGISLSPAPPYDE